MPEYINLKIDIGVPNGPDISLDTISLEVDAYDKICVLVPADGKPKPVELQPSSGQEVEFLLIKSDFYGKDFSYTVDALKTSYILDQPLLLTGRGAISLLADKAPTKLNFTYKLDQNKDNDEKVKSGINIEILVGRDMDTPK